MPPAAASRSNQRRDVVLVWQVLRQREGAGAGEAGPAHVLFERGTEIGTEHRAVELVEDDLVVLVDRLTAEPLDIEALRARKVGDTQGDDGNRLHVIAFRWPPVGAAVKATGLDAGAKARTANAGQG